MIKFISEPQKAFRSLTFLIALGVMAILIGLIAWYVHYQSGLQSREGSTAVVVPGLLRPGNTDFEYYKTRIQIENVRAALGISFANARIAIISGIIVNDGDRKLEALELHLILYDTAGNVSKERTAFALLPREGRNAKPMEPLEKRSFTIGVESVERDWNPKQIALEITGLKYQ